MLLAPTVTNVFATTLSVIDHLPDTLTRIMAEQDITGVELAAEVGIGQSTMSNYLRRASRPSITTVEAVLRWLAKQ